MVQDLQENRWVSPPSETILRLIYQKEINLHLFRVKIDLTVDQFFDLIHDKLAITARIASMLSSILGGSQRFWKNRYEQFAENLPHSNQKILNENFQFLNSLSKARNTTIDELLDSFKISSYEHLILDYLESPKIMYSKSQKIEPSPVNIANWVRKCELLAERLIYSEPVHTFSSEKLNDRIVDILSLSKINSISKIVSKIKTILADCGVILILSPCETGNGVSGFTKTILKKYRLVVVTDRYKNNAAFWFTLFHELAHCILHNLNDTIIHYSDEEFTLASLPTNHSYQEDEANNFVERLFFPEELMTELVKHRTSYKNIMRLGVKYDLSTSLIVAQIHRNKMAPYSFFRKVYKRVEFEEIF